MYWFTLSQIMIYHVLSIKYVKLDYIEVKQNMITGYLAGYLFQNTYNKDENNFKQNINALILYLISILICIYVECERF